MNKNDIFKVNNFDLLRLLAAFQVVLHHLTTHLKVTFDQNILSDLLVLFPGVPVFFFVSGFLISKSYENNSDLSEFFLNRVLRIYPALIGCFGLSLLSVFVVGYLDHTDFQAMEFWAWIVAQLSFLQFYSPDFMRGYGVGVLNGSLWTICVELQFYIMTPIVAYFYAFRKEKYANKILIGLILLFLIFNRSYHFLDSEYGDVLWFKLLGVTFVPWIYMFLVGVYFQRNFVELFRLMGNRFLIIFLCYLFCAYIAKNVLQLQVGNAISPIVYLPMACVIFSFAFSFRTMSNKILGRNDISYGVYIYHMPVVNLLLFLGLSGTVNLLALALWLTFLLAIFSWLFIEKPSLKLKKHPLNPIRRYSQ